jgi:hypothetical protein
VPALNLSSTRKIGWTETSLEIAVALALAATAWALYHPVLRLWWMDDDFYHLRHLLTGPAGWYLYSAAEYHRLETKVLTPLFFLSMDADRRLFGLVPYPFYVHQLVSLMLAPVALYGGMRIWLPRWWAAAGAWIFVVGPVTASLAPLLMVRHYVEAVLLGALAVAAWARAVRLQGNGQGWRARGFAWTSAALYLAACLAKEIAIPLAALLPFLPAPAGARPVPLAARLRLALPHGAMLGLYAVLRSVTMSTFLGGYGFKVDPARLPAVALAQPGRIAAELVGHQASLASGVFLAALAAGILALLGFRKRPALLRLGGALLLALLPVLPVATQVEPRHALAAWIVVAVAFAVGGRALAESGRRRLAIGLAAVACLAGVAVNRQDWRVRFAAVERRSAENRFVLALREGDVLRGAQTVAASLAELRWMKEKVFHLPPGGRWFQDDYYLCAHPEPLGRVWSWDPEARRVADVTPRIPDLRNQYCSEIRAGAPLAAHFHVSGGVLRWELGPHPDGTYSFLLGDGAVGIFGMPRQAGFYLHGLQPLALRVKYESPAGWLAVSPELSVPGAEGTDVRWRRE